MTQAQLLYEFSQLPLQQQLEVVQAAVQLIAQQVEAVAQPVNGRNESSRLAIAANALLADYLEDQELTSFTALDGKPFYAEGVRYGCSTWTQPLALKSEKYVLL
ncbi:MAG: hypothetical protein R3E79_54685 [Caldilineaceae bacterium]